ncbi:MAG: universal stress protein [Pseudomonadota bacterium]
MSISVILVPLRGDGKGEGVLAHAAAVAARHKAHVMAMHCRAKPSDMVPYGVVVPQALRAQIQSHATELANAEETALRDKYQAFIQSLGLDLIGDEKPPRDQASAGWCEEQGKQMDVIKRRGRLVDLVAVAKPDRDRNLGVNTLRAALFNTGRPVLLCPAGVPSSAGLGRCVALAWNGSTEASRAVALALPHLQAADEVVVLDGSDGSSGASGQDLMSYLEVAGIPARREAIVGGDRPGRVILSKSDDVGADLLVMGAYSRSREQESVFGGATQEVVDATTMPVVMVH